MPNEKKIVGLFSVESVLKSAHGVLHLAGGAVRAAFSLQLFIAGHLAGCFLDGALCLAGGAFNAILVHFILHCWSLSKPTRGKNVPVKFVLCISPGCCRTPRQGTMPESISAHA